MTQVKTKFDTNTRTSEIIRTLCHFGKLARRMVIWIQCLQWPNITTCGKYPSVCVMPQRYFVFICCSANTSKSVSMRKRKRKRILVLVLVLALALFLMLHQGRFHGDIEDITCQRVDMNFIFECSTRYLTRSLRSHVRYRVEHEKIKFISTSGHVIFCLLY